MKDQVMQCFWDEFERFHDLGVKQIEACPEDLWLAKRGGRPVWQQFLHLYACAEMYARPEADGSFGFSEYSREVIMLDKPADPMSRRDMLAHAAKVKDLARAFMQGLDAGRLTESHPGLSATFAKPRTLQHALMGLVRHANYHLGIIDGVFRDSGLPGVY